MAQRIAVVEPKPGDLIEIDRGKYCHWAIYDGDGYVIHFTTPGGSSFAPSGNAVPDSMMPVMSTKGNVTRERLTDVAAGNKYYINNILDDKYKPRSVSDILRDARSRVGQKMPYNVLLYNCEHFVTELRYGKPESRQVQEAAEEVGAIAAGVGVVGAAAASLASVSVHVLKNIQ